jgi:hypothetical protein
VNIKTNKQTAFAILAEVQFWNIVTKNLHVIEVFLESVDQSLVHSMEDGTVRVICGEHCWRDYLTKHFFRRQLINASSKRSLLYGILIFCN